MEDKSLAASPDTMTPTTIVSRKANPGNSRRRSEQQYEDDHRLRSRAWMTHDQLHIRGGHQVTWAIDGVPIPNTNIASNVGPRLIPKISITWRPQRGGYSSAYGDRTYGVFNVVPRLGFERNNEGRVLLDLWLFHQTNDQINFGSHTEKFAYFGSFNGNRSDYGLSTPGPDVLHDRVWGLGGMATLIYNRRPEQSIPFRHHRFGATTIKFPTILMPRPRASAMSNGSGMPLVSLLLGTYVHDRAFFSRCRPFTTSIAPITTAIQMIRRSARRNIEARNTPAPRCAFDVITNGTTPALALYGFGQHDDEFVNLIANDGSGDFAAPSRILQQGSLNLHFWRININRSRG